MGKVCRMEQEVLIASVNTLSPHWLVGVMCRGPATPTPEVTNALGTSLAASFPERVGEVLLPSHPHEGVRLHASNVRARIHTTSSFVQRQRDTPHRHCLCMQVTQLPAGEDLTCGLARQTCW